MTLLQSMTVHAKTVKVAMSTEKAFKCIRCDKSYKFASGLSRHVRTTHNAVGQLSKQSEEEEEERRWFTCRNCPRKFASMRGKNIHQARCGIKTPKTINASKKTKPMCKKCKKTFSRNDARDRHQTKCGSRSHGIDAPPRPFTSKGGSIKGLKWVMKKKKRALKSRR